MKKLDLKTYNNEIKDKNGLSVIKFGADWCGPCKSLAPILKDVSGQFSKSVNFYEVDVDKEPELSREFNVRSIPATFLLKDGKIVDSFIGLQEKTGLIELLNNLS